MIFQNQIEVTDVVYDQHFYQRSRQSHEFLFCLTLWTLAILQVSVPLTLSDPQ